MKRLYSLAILMLTMAGSIFGADVKVEMNSTTHNQLIIKMITTPRWKGGTSNDKKYFSEKRQEKVLTAVKNKEKYSWYTHVYTHVYTHNSCISLSDFVSLHRHSILLTQLSQTINIQLIYIYHEIHNIQKSQGRE